MDQVLIDHAKRLWKWYTRANPRFDDSFLMEMMQGDAWPHIVQEARHHAGPYPVDPKAPPPPEGESHAPQTWTGNAEELAKVEDAITALEAWRKTAPKIGG